MKARLLAAFAVAGVLAASPPVLAQDAGAAVQLMRGDAAATLGWMNLRKSEPERYGDDWANRILDAGAGVGWYWTDHLKTQVDAGRVTLETSRSSPGRSIAMGAAAGAGAAVGAILILAVLLAGD